MVTGLDDLADQSAGADHRHAELDTVVAPHVDVDGGGEVAGSVVGDLGGHRLQVADEGKVEERGELLQRLVVIGLARPAAA